MDKCSNCNSNPPDKDSKKGYCTACSKIALEAFHKKMEETNRLREEQRNRVKAIIAQAEDAGNVTAIGLPPATYAIGSVIIKPGTCDVATFLKRNGYPAVGLGNGKGTRLSAPPHIPVNRQSAWAMGYAGKLRELGYNAVEDIKEMPNGI